MASTLLLALLRATADAARAASLPDDPETCFVEVASALAADGMEGRGTGTPGLERASVYLAETMRRAGLRSVVRGYRHPFEVVTGVALGDGNRLHDGADQAVGQAWTPAGFSASGAFDAELVFAGFGISATDLGYDDYAGLDVRGKAVLALRFEPGENDAASPFDGKRPTRHSELRAKAIRAREAGAAALILVTPPASADEPDRLPPLSNGGPESDAGIPVLFVSRATADRWLAGSGATVAGLRDAIDAGRRPVRVASGIRVRGSVDVVPERTPTWNVVGVVPGSGALKDEVVVLGAHYDHLGRGGSGSLRPGVDAVHNGADDNASGVAATLCAASQVARSRARGDRRTLAVVAFSAEELGLGGSAAYVRGPAVGTLERTVAMVNLDMVGRLDGRPLQALGADSSPVWASLLDTARAAVPALKVQAGGDGYGPSDHMSFYTRGIPVVHLFSGVHANYHTPDDDTATLDRKGAADVVRLTTALANGLVRGERPAFVRATGAPSMAADARGYGAYFGSIPDYGAEAGSVAGVRVSGARAGSPAEAAGLLAGDLIVRMAGVTVNNLQDMTYVLREHAPGATIEVGVRRGAETLVLRATLTARAAGASGGGHGATTTSSAPAAADARFVARPQPSVDATALIRPDERHFDGLRRLTFGGDNAEAYWSPDGKRLILQITPSGGAGCDQEYVYDIAAETLTLVSSGKGRTTCGYFDYPAGDSILYATTEGADAACPAKPDPSQGYVWPVYDSFDIVRQDAAGRTTPWNPAPGYDAEATECHLDGRVVFTSTRNGDLDLYVANHDGSGLRQLTTTPGYDGGAFFTQDCARIVWRASRPTGDALADYQRLLAQGAVRPTSLDLFVMDADGTNVRQLTFDGKGSFAPFPTPDGKGVLYSSNRGSQPREFDLWFVPWEGGPPVRVTTAPGFDGFPMFSPDGRWLVFSSNRANASGGRDTDVYLTRWRP